MPKPDLSRVASPYHNYINQVQEDDLASAFANGTKNFTGFIESIPAGKQDYKYAPGKWSIKEVLQHIIDGERVFAYRALCFARMDSTPLPGFEENLWAENAHCENRKWNDLVEEFRTVRKASEILFASFNEEQLEASGIASGNPNYVLGFGYIIIGHSLHHQRIIKERYL
ncbi:MAG TPA: DinB family protein [Chitinophagaceae bacterium]|nr:DinB family protein [Chitinophagaceae bacterium]